MVFEEMVQECAIALDDIKLTPKRERKPDEEGGGETIRFYDERGHELCVYVSVDENCTSLFDAHVFYYDYEETVTKAGDLFRFARNLESTQVASYTQFCNILWAHRYQFKSTLPKGTQEFNDEDLLALIMELQRFRIPHKLDVVNKRPRISFTRDGEEVASARKSAGRLRYQNTAGRVISSEGTDGEPLKEFIATIVDDLRPAISEIKKIR
jgi:hypothetical protein